LNPVIVKSAFSSQDSGAVQGAWEIEVAQGRQKELEVGYALDGIVTRYNPAEFDYTVVWRGSVTGVENEATVDNSLGGFTGPLAGGNGLAPNTLHFLRVRQKDSAGNWSEWSSWHSGFATTWANDATSEEKTLPEGYLVQARAAILEPDDIPPVIEGTNLGAVPDSLAPYRVTATVAEINLMDVYLYWRKQGDEEYSRVEMDQVNGGSFSAGIGEYSLGTVIEYYLRARDFQRNYTYAPAAYGSEPYRFTAGEVGGTCDFNGDSKVSITDVVALLIEGRRNPGNLAVDYNRDGTYSITDVISLLLDIITGKCP
ncbi:MAG: hypothetical protein U9P14_10815, partial [Gemmatimonadota bacterium]|nr:hypothetical protein [Gemmatimonadota bacterium]